MSAYPRKYGTGTGADVYIPIIKRDVVDFAVTADWTPASGDVKISKDGGADANIGTLPVINNTTDWKFVFTDAELQAKVIRVKIVDSATKTIEDQSFTIETYGHASALHPFDLGTASTAQTGDAFARLGAPAGASVSADVAAVKAETALIVADTNELQTDDIPGLIATAQADLDILTGTNGATLATSQPNYAPLLASSAPTNFSDLSISATTGLVSVGSLGANTVNASALASDAVTEIQNGLATATNVSDAQTAILAEGAASWTTATGFSTHSASDVWLVATRVLTAGTNLTIPTAIENADATLRRAISNVEATADKHSLALLVSIATNSSATGTTLTAKKPSDDTTWFTYTLTVDAAADPVTGVA